MFHRKLGRQQRCRRVGPFIHRNPQANIPQATSCPRTNLQKPRTNMQNSSVSGTQPNQHVTARLKASLCSFVRHRRFTRLHIAFCFGGLPRIKSKPGRLQTSPMLRPKKQFFHSVLDLLRTMMKEVGMFLSRLSTLVVVAVPASGGHSPASRVLGWLKSPWHRTSEAVACSQ